VLGLAFKPGTDDVRESPGLRIAKMLLLHGAQVVLHDPVVQFEAVHAQLGEVTQAGDVADAATEADAVVIATGWDAYRDIEWNDIVRRMRSPVILDGRQVVSAECLMSGTTLLATGRRTEVVRHGRVGEGSPTNMTEGAA